MRTTERGVDGMFRRGGVSAGVPVILALVLAFSVGPSLAQAQKTIRITVSFAPVEAQQLTREYAAAFEKANPSIRVRAEYIPWEQLRPFLLTSFTAGSAPDIIHASSVQSSLEMKAIGAWTDLSTYMTPEWKAKQQFLDGAFDELGPFGVPLMRVTEGVVFYSKSAFARAGVQAPPVDQAWTWEEFVAAAQKLTIREGNVTKQWGFGDRGRLGFILTKAAIPYFFSAGGDIIYQKEGRWRSGFELPEVQEALTFYVDLYRKHQVKDPGNLGWGLPEATRAWKSGAVAMINVGEWFRDQMVGEFEKDWDVMLFPVRRGSRPFVTRQQVYWHISRGSRNKDEAWKFINYLMTPERIAEFGRVDTDSPPATKLALQQPYWARNAFVQQRISRWAKTSKDMMSPHPRYAAIWESVVGPIIHDAVQGRMTVGDAIKTLNTEINKELGVP